jgi:aspartyl-tRNA(Asn)/glutamyl-tRNA(Gln) amidotransferase subunit A
MIMNKNALLDLTIQDASKLLKAKEISSYELTTAYLDRISDRDDTIGAYVTVCRDEALKQAKLADKMLQEGSARSPLTGIPFSLKDNFCTKGIRTTCASRMLENFIPPYDAHVASKLKCAGAVMLGKVNMDEFAMGCTTETSIFRRTVNPLDVTRVPGGSSGGSAASVAARESVFSIGSDTGGSVRQPAAFCGAIGFKPSYGRISRYGMIAFSSYLDTVGLVTRSVYDSALLLEALAGKDPNDATSADRSDNDFTSGIGDGVRGMRIGFVRESLNGTSADVRRNTESAISMLRTLGARIDEISLPVAEFALCAYHILGSAEASSNLARFDGIRYGYRASDCDSVGELIRRSRSEGFGDEVKRRIILGAFSLSSENFDEYYKKAVSVREYLKCELDDFFEKYDAIITPTSPSVAHKFDRTGDFTDEYASDAYTVIASMAQLPAISVPSGKGEGDMPTALQIITAKFEDAKALRISYALSEAL